MFITVGYNLRYFSFRLGRVKFIKMSRKEEGNGSGEGWESEELQSSGDDWEPGKEEGSEDSEERERDAMKKGIEGVKRRLEFGKVDRGGGRKGGML